MAENEKNKLKLNDKDTKSRGRPKFKIVEKFRNLKGEYKKIKWASPKTTFKSFGIVLVGVALTAIIIGVIDWGLASVFDLLLKHISF